MVVWDFSGWAWNGAWSGRIRSKSRIKIESGSDMTNVNSTDFLRVVDHAAAMNDRWLFLAAFCLLLLGCGVVIYWLVKQLQAVLAGHKAARDAHQVALTQIIASQNETALKLAVCIDRNTAAMEERTMELRRIRERD